VIRTVRGSLSPLVARSTSRRALGAPATACCRLRSGSPASSPTRLHTLGQPGRRVDHLLRQRLAVQHGGQLLAERVKHLEVAGVLAQRGLGGAARLVGELAGDPERQRIGDRRQAVERVVVELAPRVDRHHADDPVLDPQRVAGERDDLLVPGPLGAADLGVDRHVIGEVRDPVLGDRADVVIIEPQRGERAVERGRDPGARAQLQGPGGVVDGPDPRQRGIEVPDHAVGAPPQRGAQRVLAGQRIADLAEQQRRAGLAGLDRVGVDLAQADQQAAVRSGAGARLAPADRGQDALGEQLGAVGHRVAEPRGERGVLQRRAALPQRRPLGAEQAIGLGIGIVDPPVATHDHDAMGQEVEHRLRVHHRGCRSRHNHPGTIRDRADRARGESVIRA
jgi:hypothetical protein